MPQPTKPQLAIYAALAIAVLLVGARFLRSGQEGAEGGFAGDAPAVVSPETGAGAPDGASADPAGTPDDASTAGGGATGPVVDVKGAVRRPGVYRLDEGARALDAVERAGGLSGRADRRGVNLAARVVDGGELIVPRKGERVSGSGSASAAGSAAVGAGVAGSAVAGAGGAAGGAAAGAPLVIDLDTATAQELEQLDGVGPATAAKIVAYREQHGGIGSVEELDEVSGIGEAKMAAIRAQLGR